jgi:hypothetical protein
MQDPKTEQYLSAGRYAFVFAKDVPIRDIDMGEAKANPARLQRRIDDDRVNAYGIAMLDGADFPAIVLFDDEPKKHLVTGLHRLTAAQDAHKTVFDAYLVRETDEYRRQLLMRSINTIEGKAPDVQEQLNHACEILRQFPGSLVKDIAAAFNMKPDAIVQYQHKVAAEHRAIRLMVGDEFSGLPSFTKIEIGRVASDVTFPILVRAIAGTKARGNVATDLIKSVRGVRSEEAANKIIERHVREFREEQERARARYGKTPTAASTRFLGRVKVLTKETNLSKLALNGIFAEKLPDAIHSIEQARELLERVHQALVSRLAELEKRKWTTTGRSESVQNLQARSGNG